MDEFHLDRIETWLVRAPHNLPPSFFVLMSIYFVVQLFIYFLEKKYHFEFSRLHPFLHVLATHVIYIYIYIYISIFMNWFMFPPFMFCHLISRSSFEFQTIVVGLCCMMWSWIPKIPPPSHSKIVSTKMLCLDNGMKK